ncbi:response regulator transcription factor [Corynebacterium felinum]|uniref:Two-component system response regulator DesR n=1 Tax=Corynebacterium felinum TaxID=131318 RepID=A0ABU2BAG9_9CORY|nr:response regulator transcription factor [Corynebacterium felinum]MDF5819486.1 response regulator transcription factor [Corynebacterium felinum]MDR7355617.1 two-component system response regulator DesR [Corynebacterium felinum]WJY94969.1 Oxygen regulatory protein NreC [Corynebacterium felinum]
MIRVLVADDQALVRAALAALLNLEADIEVVAEAHSGNHAVQQAHQHQPDIALIDIDMPDGNGLDTTFRITTEIPHCRCIIVTTFGRPGYLRTALKAGASGFVIKDTPPEALADAIRKVHSGLRAIDPQLAEESLLVPDCPLTEREITICQLLLKGTDAKTIAKKLFITAGTVRNLFSSIITKTGTTNRYEAARIAHSYGWL